MSIISNIHLARYWASGPISKPSVIIGHCSDLASLKLSRSQKEQVIVAVQVLGLFQLLDLSNETRRNTPLFSDYSSGQKGQPQSGSKMSRTHWDLGGFIADQYNFISVRNLVWHTWSTMKEKRTKETDSSELACFTQRFRETRASEI